MHTPSHARLRRTIRRGLLAASLLLLACGSDGDEYAPLGTDPVVRATVVAGIVRDANRGTVSDAVVVMEPANDGVPASVGFLSENLAKNVDAPAATTPGRRVTTTNLRGNFAFENVETGEYYLQVIADDHLGAMHSIRVPDHTVFVDTVYVDVNLTPTGTFSGVATLENATAHQGTVVYVQGTSYVAVTDPAGNYALTDVPVGSYTVRAEHAHYLEDTESGTITTAGENVALASMLLKINSNIPPVATIVSASPLVGNVPVQFVATGSDADGTVVLYEWDWEDDGTFDYSSPSSGNASHTYSTGDFMAKLRVTDDDGAIGLAVIQLDIDPNAEPTANIVSASPQTEGVPVNFGATGTDTDGTIVLYQWDWEDDGTFDASSTTTGNASHLYAVGSYTARFRVTDDDGGFHEDTIGINIIAQYVYLSSTHGNDSFPGTISQPVQTLAIAYVRAQTNGFLHILAEEGNYSEVPTFLGSIGVLGGRVWPSFAEGVSHSVFQVGTIRATANNITTATLIRRVTIQTSNAVAGNSIALYATNSNANLRFEECRFIASNAGVGASGTSSPVFGQNGGIGVGGSNGSCDSNGPGAPGGPGGSSGACAGGAGGNGGNSGTNSGQPGQIGGCSGGAGGSGGSGGDPGGDGSNGAPGAPGGNGTAGSVGSPSGTISGGNWTPITSSTGTAGVNGRGGGGGGGGGGQGCTLCDDGFGNGGGGGGGGGTGGGAGAGGQGGFASFAVFLLNASPTVVSCYFESRNGGNGGFGGVGRAGGTGGSGAPGAVACSSEIGEGGDGGNGGAGGSGAGGPGGSGGPSYCIYRASGSTPSIVGPTYVVGTPGSGGAGGANGGGGTAANGLSGISGNVF